jgi:hypothetical protein
MDAGFVASFDFLLGAETTDEAAVLRYVRLVANAIGTGALTVTYERLWVLKMGV